MPTAPTLLAFAADIGMVPIALHKEKAGYVLNSLLVPLLNAAAELAAARGGTLPQVDAQAGVRHREGDQRITQASRR